VLEDGTMLVAQQIGMGGRRHPGLVNCSFSVLD
jgi:hypothetical protein